MSSKTVSSMQLSRRKPLAACVAAIFALSVPGLVHAVPFDWKVTNCKDDGTPGTLRWAANNANGATADTINLTTITDFSDCITSSGLIGVQGQLIADALVVGSTISLATGGVTINGPGVAKLSITAAAQSFRVISSPGDLAVNNLTVKYASPTKTGGAYYGGCIYAHYNLTLSSVQLGHCYLTNTGAAKGGAVASYDDDVNMTNVVINHSSATSSASNAFGGAVYAFENTKMINSKIYAGTGGTLGAYVTGGSGSALGGAVHSHASTAYLSSSNISTTQATVSTTTGGSASGGGIWAAGKVTLTDGSAVVSGKASTTSTVASKNSYGGGVYSASTATPAVSLYASTVEFSSTATSSSGGFSRGGGIFAKGPVDARYAYITINSAVNGGGVYASNGFTSYYSYFWDNSATGNGGAVDLKAGNALVRGTSVAFNTAGSCCSGLDFHDGSNTNTVSVTQSTIAKNYGNFPLYSRALTAKIYNSTVAYNDNTAGLSAGPEIVGPASATLTIASNLISSNTYGASHAKNDLIVSSAVTINGDHNLIRNPGSTTTPPLDTIIGKCPLLYPGKFTFIDKQDQFVIRHEVKSPATNNGSNPLALGADQRGGQVGATSPARVSGEPGTPARPDIGSYEINESDEVFDNRFETCT